MSLFTRFLLFFIVLIWLMGVFLLFFVPIWEPLIKLVPIANLLCSRVCHQIPNKLIYYNEAHTFVCARCVGIYAGAFAGSLYILFNSEFRISLKLLLLSSLPLFADILLYSTGVYNYSHYIAFFTGLLFGTICFFYIFQGLKLLIPELRSGK